MHASTRDVLGMTRGLLVQPAPYANDPGAMLAAILMSGGALRGVASASEDVSDATLTTWRKSGIIGLRFVEMRAPDGRPYPGSVPFRELEALAPRMQSLGLQAHLWASAETHAEWLPRLRRLGVPLILEHMACPDVSGGVDAAPFRAILDAVGSGETWVKLVLARVTKRPDGGDARPFHDALIAAAPERMLWGSDWPYVRMVPPPDASVMYDLFCDWVDEDVRHTVLVDNPANLFFQDQP